MDSNLKITLCILGFTFLFLGAMGLLGYIVTGDQHDAIVHNAAHYDTKTGEFTWNQ